MTYEEETEYVTSYYQCIDRIENFKIKVILKPVKDLIIPLPQFDKENCASELSSFHEDNPLDVEEYIFNWQEKVFSKNEIKKYSEEPDWKKKLEEKYHCNFSHVLKNLKNHPRKLFSYVEVDNYSVKENNVQLFKVQNNYTSSLSKKMSELKMSEPKIQNFRNISKRKVINFCPSNEFKDQSHFINKSVQKMYIMADISSKIKGGKKIDKEENSEVVLCILSYDHSRNLLEMTPSFSQSKLKPYYIGSEIQNARNSYCYWLYHASSSISKESLSKELQLMSKIYDHQEDLRKLQMGTEFFLCKPDCFYVTLLGEITSAQDFEYDYLHIHYFIKLPSGSIQNSVDSLIGITPTSQRNSQGVAHFCHLFEMNFFLDVKFLEDSLSACPELFFEVLSVDKYSRYRNEGYAYISVPMNPGMYKYNLRCWRAADQTLRSQLERFFIGGGSELEDVSYVGLVKSEKTEVTSRFGFRTVPSGLLDVKLNIIHQSEALKSKKIEVTETEKNVLRKMDAGALLGSINVVLEAFRQARKKMLQAKTGLETHFSDVLYH